MCGGEGNACTKVVLQSRKPSHPSDIILHSALLCALPLCSLRFENRPGSCWETGTHLTLKGRLYENLTGQREWMTKVSYF